MECLTRLAAILQSICNTFVDSDALDNNASI